MAYNFARKYNKVRWKVSIKDGAEYINLSAPVMENAQTVNALYKNTKSKYGTQYCAVIKDGSLIVNLPRHLNDTCASILEDDEAINAINAGKVGIKCRGYTKNGKEYYTVEWMYV